MGSGSLSDFSSARPLNLNFRHLNRENLSRAGSAMGRNVMESVLV
jgi:hypothetical protein